MVIKTYKAYNNLIRGCSKSPGKISRVRKSISDSVIENTSASMVFQLPSGSYAFAIPRRISSLARFCAAHVLKAYIPLREASPP